MFERFFHITVTPFTRDVPPETCYQAPAGPKVLGRLVYAAQKQWFTVVTGDCGVGKSTTIRRLTATLDRAMYKVLDVADSKLTPRHFYKGLLEQLGYEAKFYREMPSANSMGKPKFSAASMAGIP
ncbi:AAA ATPase [Sulfobacillus acidophilus TPY]|nr:AAA ATPase [Sulfobacillus acidophilus TPY]